ncbi:uncharacterized protein LOC132273688 isoform X2 [Cornus florida]|uniref:uncharacterized protein LOC132273688 isoform X2 n=1 Tax=Cornus florida TaxID=4283 RepID=UPI00289C242A|nr:uncharacterized protein LOC132273688 isoform X2 [Cornus florida]
MSNSSKIANDQHYIHVRPLIGEKSKLSPRSDILSHDLSRKNSLLNSFIYISQRNRNQAKLSSLIGLFYLILELNRCVIRPKLPTISIIFMFVHLQDLSRKNSLLNSFIYISQRNRNQTKLSSLIGLFYLILELNRCLILPKLPTICIIFMFVHSQISPLGAE